MRAPYLLGLLTWTLFSTTVAVHAAPIVVGGTYYRTTGPTETLTATFTTADGGVTAGLYSGLVDITVSGIGNSDAAFVNDAFYYFPTSTPTHDSSYYQLTFGTKTLLPLTPSQDATNYIVYDLDAGKAVTPPYTPAYESSHTYDLVLNTNSLSLVNLHFGVSDGQFNDNGGAYTIAVTQLVVPEPASWATLGTGLGLLFGVARVRRRRSAGNVGVS